MGNSAKHCSAQVMGPDSCENYPKQAAYPQLTRSPTMHQACENTHVLGGGQKRDQILCV